MQREVVRVTNLKKLEPHLRNVNKMINNKIRNMKQTQFAQNEINGENYICIAILSNFSLFLSTLYSFFGI